MAPRGRRGRKQARRARKGGKKQRKTVNVNRALQPIPQRYICKMKYAEDVSTDGLTGRYMFNLNSVFDPNRTGTGHQPYAFDTLSSLYNRYRVISCGWRVTSPTSSTVLQTGCMPANEQVTMGSFAELKENPRAKYFTQNPGGQALVLSGKTYLPSLVGRTKQQYMADDRYQADVASSPAELAVLNLFVANSTGTFITAPINVLLEYTVEFFDVKPLAQS